MAPERGGAARTAGLPVVDVCAAASRAGVRCGDLIMWLDGEPPVDVLDLEMAAADGAFRVTVLRDGRPLELSVELGGGEWHGISLGHQGLGAPPRVCRNRCRFCFVDQVPRGLRAPLYVKDDDYRLSFLHGNFTTLTNLAEADIMRIESLRLSPLYVSLHAWDDAARVRLMGAAAAGSRAVLERLAAAGLELHLQVVLCPGWNDGEVLAETIARTGALDSVSDLGIVPVSLAAEGELRRVTAVDARGVLDLVERAQAGFLAGRGRRFVHAADELYLLAGRTPPAGDAPEQYENGIGMAALFQEEVDDLVMGAGEGIARGSRSRVPAGGVRILTGALAEPVIAAGAARLKAALGRPVRAFPVFNRLFGSHVTVTGLLGGEEVRAALARRPLADDEWLVAPRGFLPAALGRTLDDVGAGELAAACGGRLILAESLTEAFGTLLGCSSRPSLPSSARPTPANPLS